ncbi:hypothetical protein RHGRI_003407 [Rhododendron griersonianum]|uniref:RING-type E3 ubiquitin transferase n=1 Tax=Rhododendron griersonianum TaxID=479676 RepID=A0AAV6L681_9ERIC|nr:hypothetical protein RHGRI_003407 [Rhododendron griersonianum]
MSDFLSSLQNPPIIPPGSSSSAAAVFDDDDFEDSCSICLEPFISDDPPTVTTCRHEYHLQCILEWSQRSKECPICCQLLVLKDPGSQGLLAAVEKERNLRSRRSAHIIHEDYEINHDNSYSDEPEFEERIMRDFAAAAHRARHIGRRGRHRSFAVATSQVLSDVQHMPTTSSSEPRSSNYEFSEGDSPTFSTLTTIHAQTPSSVVPNIVHTGPSSASNRHAFIKLSQLPPESPQRPSSSEFLAFSESIKSKFSAASARYKESFSKFTRVVKEKQLAHNITVKDLGREVQREMNASIAGVARMIERLDLNSKHTGVSVPLSSSPGGTSNLSYKGKDTQECEITESPNEIVGENVCGMSSVASSCVKSIIPGQSEASLVQLCLGADSLIVPGYFTLLEIDDVETSAQPWLLYSTPAKKGIYAGVYPSESVHCWCLPFRVSPFRK